MAMKHGITVPSDEESIMEDSDSDANYAEDNAMPYPIPGDYNCDQCDNAFTQLDDLNLHKESQHGGEESLGHEDANQVYFIFIFFY